MELFIYIQNPENIAPLKKGHFTSNHPLNTPCPPCIVVYTDSQQLLDINRQPVLSDTMEICWSTYIPEKIPLPFPPLPSFREHIHHIVVSVAFRTNPLKLIKSKDKLKRKALGTSQSQFLQGLVGTVFWESLLCFRAQSPEPGALERTICVPIQREGHSSVVLSLTIVIQGLRLLKPREHLQ